MVKIKNLRSADCVVGGFRYGTKGKVVGSLLLGLYDDDGCCITSASTSSIHADERDEITAKLEALRGPPGFTGRAPGGPSRWSTERSTEWEPLDPSSWWKCSTITSPAAASAMAPSCCAGARTKRRAVHDGAGGKREPLPAEPVALAYNGPMTRRALLAGSSMAAATRSLDILETPAPQADARIAYGPDPHQFGDLRVPRVNGPHPVVIFIHGGFWKAKYSLEHAGHLCAALTNAGAATWSLEYRRIGDPGGGWPGTLADVKQGTQHLRKLASAHSLDLDRVVVAGHSAGGQLALWLAAERAIPLRGVVSLAGVLDLKRAFELGLSKGIVATFLGGSPAEVPERYAQASPIQRLPIATPQRLLHGTRTRTCPSQSASALPKLPKMPR